MLLALALNQMEAFATAVDAPIITGLADPLEVQPAWETLRLRAGRGSQTTAPGCWTRLRQAACRSIGTDAAKCHREDPLDSALCYTRTTAGPPSADCCISQHGKLFALRSVGCMRGDPSHSRPSASVQLSTLVTSFALRAREKPP